MTDARFPETYLNDRRVLQLSDANFRLYVVATAWCVANRTDGVFDRADLALMHGVDPGGTDELVKAGLAELAGEGWLLTDYERFQTTRHELDVLDNARRRDRLKKARQRAEQADQSEPVPGDVPRDTRSMSPGTAQEGRKAGSEGRTKPNHAGTVASADTCVHPGCHNPPRHGLLTCLDHARLEIDYQATA